MERKRQFDMAMEMHALQARVTDAATAHGALTRQLNELATTLGGRNDVPADVKANFDAVKKEVDALGPRLTRRPAGAAAAAGAAATRTTWRRRSGRPRTR